MRSFLFSLCTILCFTSQAQSRWTTAFSVNRQFNIGDSKSYEVTDFFKIDNLLLGIRSEVTSLVNFRVVDTAQGGYWIMYSVHSSSVKQHKDSTAYIAAHLVDGIRLFLYVKGDYLSLDSATYADTKKRVSDKLVSMTSYRTFDNNTTQYIEKLKAELAERDGLGSLLGPLGMFETYYLSKEYKQFRLTGDAAGGNIFNETSFGGEISREWKHTSKDSTAELNLYFSANPVQAAAYFKPLYQSLFDAAHVKTGRFFYPPEMRYSNDYTFKAKPGVSFPSYLYKKNVSEYILRSVARLEMKEVKTDEVFIIIKIIVPRYIPPVKESMNQLRSI